MLIDKDRQEVFKKYDALFFSAVVWMWLLRACEDGGMQWRERGTKVSKLKPSPCAEIAREDVERLSCKKLR